MKNILVEQDPKIVLVLVFPVDTSVYRCWTVQRCLVSLCVALKTDKEDPRAVMDRLCKFIYTKDSTDRIRTRAILCHLYHHAVHGRWYEARDLMLMSHLQDSVQHSDIPTQVRKLESAVSIQLLSYCV